jgi:hypothetical protein
MDFNATIDLIVKDLEDARKIIDDLKKYPGVPALQIEFAKSKCKSAAEVIALLKTMNIHIQAKPEPKDSPASGVNQEPQKPVESGREETPKEVSDRHEPILRQNEGNPEAKKIETEPEVKINEVGPEERRNEVEPKKESEAETQIIRTEVIKSEPITNETALTGLISDENVNKPPSESIKKEETRKVVVKSSRSILADSFSHLSSRLNEDVSAIHKKTLFEAIGINDSFFYIREIFDGDKAAYTEAIMKLDKSENLREAKAIIMSYTKKNDENEAVLQLLDLLKRKFHLHE